MKTTAAVLFDLDGTLLDTAPEFTHCLKLLLKEEAKEPVSVEALRASVSFGAKGMLCTGFKLNEQDPYLMTLLPRFLALYQKHIGQLTHFFPGMESILELISRKGLAWGIVTNKPLGFTTALVSRFSALQKTQCIVAGDSLPRQKPDPMQLLHAADVLKVEPTSCWYIGDAKTDLEASRRANMRCAIANYGYIPVNEDAASWQADVYLASPLDIEQLLKE